MNPKRTPLIREILCQKAHLFSGTSGKKNGPLVPGHGRHLVYSILSHFSGKQKVQMFFWPVSSIGSLFSQTALTQASTRAPVSVLALRILGSALLRPGSSSSQAGRFTLDDLFVDPQLVRVGQQGPRLFDSFPPLTTIRFLPLPPHLPNIPMPVLASESMPRGC